MFLFNDVRSARLFSTWAFVILAPLSQASAQCSDAKVQRLAEEGETIAEIADECEISKAEVRKILKHGLEAAPPHKDPPLIEGTGFARGTPLAACGCYGPIDLRLRQQAPQCASGYAQPQLCNAMCQMGGLMWQGVCL